MDPTILRWVSEEMNDLLGRLPVMEQRQFFRALYLVTGFEGYDLTEVATHLAGSGVVIFTENGYVTNKNSYDIVAANPDVRLAESGIRRIPVLIPKPYFAACMECFNLVLDLYPVSKQFYLGRDLFHVVFADEEKERIYELIRIPEGKELFYEALLVKESAVYQGKIGGHIRDATRRIALVQSEACAGAVPYCGFSVICRPDRNAPKGFSVIEKRKGDLWKDALTAPG